MTGVSPWVWAILAIVIGGGILYGLHRLALALEDRGYLYYRRKSSTGGCSGALMELDRIARPSVQHVVEVTEEAEQEKIAPIDGE